MHVRHVFLLVALDDQVLSSHVANYLHACREGYRVYCYSCIAKIQVEAQICFTVMFHNSVLHYDVIIFLCYIMVCYLIHMDHLHCRWV